MLYEFLLAERKNILALCASKLLGVGGLRSSSAEMEVGLPIFYDELVEALRIDGEHSGNVVDQVSGTVHRNAALRRGKESLRLGYTISQVVHGYGALCQAITQYAEMHSDEPICAREFNRLNFCLDVAIAEAVTGFSDGQQNDTAKKEIQRLGFLAHEMRNALATAALAHRLIKQGLVGIGGSTNKVLEDALLRMQNIVDRSLSEVRLRGEPTVEHQRCEVVDFISEIEAIALSEADAKTIRLHIDIAAGLVVTADRHLAISAISNVVQNAIKFTKPGGNVWIRARANDAFVVIEIEDECGGLPSGKIEALFEPFTQKGLDRTGVGLGLAISRRAIDLNAGTLAARDIPGTGCNFTIELPRYA